ncbi:cytochrome ubiquinol oxidase subunit I [Nocardioides anomalus]|uniref:Cytochrome ubiquinol oxidase subunit I n=1 Tax=Nocardioides anomalus TaxID=2712223 RepID=A0A6G6WAK2_9ACTN|nr:cytochrome ubiquinol oxidase subunit I [Nocardioides anomalus]QIG42254.1 cytochrome ubiquinol oxidase subunit I [Nocardioides anomalus]
MDVVDIARWQFGITTVYHFLFVPLTIGLTALVAVLETRWVWTRDPALLRLTRFFGKLLLINFAIGVVTGIVQEFQFGMNWSDYSRFVGDVFGAPLAIEGLLAFFLESTFLGLWIFGWDKLPRGLHAACMWVVHLGTLFSAWFILAANSWMQHPVGYRYDAESGRAELTDFWAVMFNKVQLVTFPHVVLAAYLTAGLFLVAVSGWLHASDRHREDRAVHRTALRLGAAVAMVAGLGVAVSGDLQGKVMTEVQPMKMAAAEGLYETRDSCAPFSVLTIGSLDGREEKKAFTVPCLLSFLGTGSVDGRVEGIDDLRAEYAERYGQDPGSAYYQVDDYVPVVPVTYWSFRLMIGLGMGAASGGALVLWLTRRGRTPSGRWFRTLCVALPLGAAAGNSFGWIFTEMGRQPWVVFGLMTTDHAVSPSVSVTEALISVVTLTALYGVLAVIEIGLILLTVRSGPAPYVEPAAPDDDAEDRPLAFAY